MESDCSGNHSENDEINKLRRFNPKRRKQDTSSSSENEEVVEEVFSPKTEERNGKPKNGINILYKMEVKETS